MKRMILCLALFGVLPLSMIAQDDDVYFVPKKTAEAERSYGRIDQKSAYYVGSKRDVDEYNRRGKYWSHYQKIGTDTKGNDIIEFRKGNGLYPDSMYIDTTFVGRYYDTMVEDADDFRYSTRMRMWDGFYDPWFYPYYMNYPYYRYRYYGYAYNPWYTPWYNNWAGYYGWYDPWYYPGWYGYGWGYPYYYGGYWGGGYWPHHYVTVTQSNRPAGWHSYSFGNRADSYNRQSSKGRTFSSRVEDGTFRSRGYTPNNDRSSNVYRGHNGTFSGRNNTPTRSYTPESSFPLSGGFGSRGGGSFGGGSTGGARSGGSFGGGGGRFGHR
ncbi:hypothetical protein JHU38_01535 [Prevotella sp. A2931]|uniref:DUF3300 domain-containing protein n=1 Tax=Prevotella illustrans TaxID=2800387 RepID=A0ABS3M2Q8_9BACT|nr:MULTISPECIES: hypothetical protein [Prevotella]MBO1362477.1 hypothetical protein [Prevotella illustrans]PTL25016.1 hypothetical protein C3V39_09805 [Prevotella sp. oral taxon 820]